MLSIGEIAHRTGVSRRMLRHWEVEGLLAPADVDPVSGYRFYAETQVGHVRAIAGLRELGFGLGEIAGLLGPDVDRVRLEQALSAQAARLRAEISTASTRLHAIQHRLEALTHQTQEIVMNLSLTSLPALTVYGGSTVVVDEAEIGTAVEGLRAALPTPNGGLVMIYDGSRDDQIRVCVGVGSPTAGERIDVDAVESGVTVHCETAPESVADAWVLIDAELEKQGLTTHGVYRHLVDGSGATTLCAPVRHLKI